MTIKELAKILNISTSTVSKALNDSHEISADTKMKVQQLAKELHFQPNPHASSLRKNKNKTIAVVIPEIANNFFARAIDGIETVALEKGYHVLIYLTHENYTKEDSIIRHLLNGRVDGVITSFTLETTNFKHYQELLDRNIPLVLFDRVSLELDAAKVITDDLNAGFVATKHLIDIGCKNIAYLGFSATSYASVKRKEGYLKALHDHKIHVNDKIIVDCTNDMIANYSTLANMLKNNKKVDAVFCSAESLAILTYQYCYENLIKIPEHIKVVSFSNMSVASYLNPSLTTITQPAFEMGKEAAALLFKSIEKTKVNYRDEVKVLKSNLYIRNSTKTK